MHNLFISSRSLTSLRRSIQCIHLQSRKFISIDNSTLGQSKPLCYISTVNDPYTNLAIEEWLFRSTPSDLPVLYLWRNSTCVVLGRNQNPWKECNVRQLEKDNVPYIRRKSGGGTVYHDMGNSIYTIFFPKAKFSRKFSAELVSRALNDLDIPSNLNGRHDIVVDGKKVSGSAYKITSSRAYHHGTMLIDSDLDTLRKYLKVDRPTMKTKGVPSVASPVTKLREYSYTVTHSDFCDSVMKQFRKAYNISVLKVFIVFSQNVLHDIPDVRKYREELMSWDWLHGQSPEFTYEFSKPYKTGELVSR
ncbi:hypothetical protein BKA69DRAFT_1026886 [Paraphysoderma sedebokerense]|nr:hypothetical protein BKA69DRAFT_1026886 [Paraphysoderma sedebokerense]